MGPSNRLDEAFCLSPDFFFEGAIAAGFVGSLAAETPEDQTPRRVVDEGERI